MKLHECIGPDYEAFRHYYAIFDGIPATKVNLEVVVYTAPPHDAEPGWVDDDLGAAEIRQHPCRTQACFIGWVSMHPDAEKRGVKYHMGRLWLDGLPSNFVEVAKRLFHIDDDEAVEIFADSPSQYDADYLAPMEKLPYKNDKERVQYRIRAFLKQHRQL